jgi:transposase
MRWAGWAIALKKTLRASEQDRADVKLRREQWRVEQTGWDAGKLVFLDESCAKTNMTRLRGRARQGERVHDCAPHGHWGTTTLLGALRLDGTSACMSVEGATDRDVFDAYVRRVLVPSLRPGDTVVLDNLSAHDDARARQWIEAAGAQLLFLPPYSPDLNPIEKMWSKIKAALRAAKARTSETLQVAIRDALATVTAQDAVGWFQSCGYTASQY